MPFNMDLGTGKRGDANLGESLFNDTHTRSFSKKLSLSKLSLSKKLMVLVLTIVAVALCVVALLSNRTKPMPQCTQGYSVCGSSCSAFYAKCQVASKPTCSP